jgi:hypothetical protein
MHSVTHSGIKCLASRSFADVTGISLGKIGTLNFEALGYVLGSDDGIWLGDLPARGLGDTLGRTIGNEVLAMYGRRRSDGCMHEQALV